jgi:hypothetical protein
LAFTPQTHVKSIHLGVLMFQPWRFKLRQAETALHDGRLEEAGQMLRQPDVCEFLPAKKLMRQLAGQMAHRGKQRMNAGQSSAGWHDLEAAESLGADAKLVAQVRNDYISRRLREVENYLRAGEPSAALAQLDELTRRGAATEDVRLWKQTAARLLAADRLGRQGLFSQAESELAAAAVLRPTLSGFLETGRKACRVKAGECRQHVEQLHAALLASDWSRALTEAEALIELCPEHATALAARRKAWAAVGMSQIGARPAPAAAARPHFAAKRMHDASPSPNAEDPSEIAPPGPRFLLWIDGVGGYLVCTGSEVTLGQPVPGSQVDVPILADISRRHATIRRDGESYLLNPLRPVKINGRTIDKPTTLTDGCLIEMGSGLQLRFRRPHPLSATARLDFVSRHRTQPAADGILLLADSCILGPGNGSHVPCRHWAHDVLLYQQGEQLYCRATSKLEIDGVAAPGGNGPITRKSQVSGEDFSLKLEEI